MLTEQALPVALFFLLSLTGAGDREMRMVLQHGSPRLVCLTKAGVFNQGLHFVNARKSLPPDSFSRDKRHTPNDAKIFRGGGNGRHAMPPKAGAGEVVWRHSFELLSSKLQYRRHLRFIRSSNLIQNPNVLDERKLNFRSQKKRLLFFW